MEEEANFTLYVMLQLRYLQTLNSISAENNSTIVFPVPVDIVSSILPQVQFRSQLLTECFNRIISKARTRSRDIRTVDFTE